MKRYKTATQGLKRTNEKLREWAKRQGELLEESEKKRRTIEAEFLTVRRDRLSEAAAAEEMAKAVREMGSECEAKDQRLAEMAKHNESLEEAIGNLNSAVELFVTR